MRWNSVAVLATIGTIFVASAEVTMEKKAFAGWPNCIVLSNGKIEVVVTTDVGPRIIRFGFVGGQNVFREYKEFQGKTGGDEWRIYGGHRFWHAPEAKPRTYVPDNSPVKYEWNGSTLRLTQDTEVPTGIQKQIEVTVDPKSDHVTVLHRAVNRNQWDIEFAPWALSVMAQKGRGIYPQEEFRDHNDYLLPARPMVLWHYTDMQDPRWSWGTKYVQLRQDPANTKAQKLGILNKKGWAAFTLNGDVFIKRFPFVADAHYPDYNCNCETFTNEDMLEIESLGPLQHVSANGGSVEHVENWYLFKADIGTKDNEIEKTLEPLIAKTK